MEDYQKKLQLKKEIEEEIQKELALKNQLEEKINEQQKKIRKLWIESKIIMKLIQKDPKGA